MTVLIEFGPYAPFVWTGYGVSVIGFLGLVGYTLWMRGRTIRLRRDLQKSYDDAQDYLDN